MNGSQIINMVLRIVMRKGINSAINAGVKQVSGRRPAPAGPANAGRVAPQSGPTEADRAEQQRIRAARRARRAARQG
ncbi:hypothetical protein [Pseudaestuariivita atlantica]|uniref:Uncharacterized protein n=1 Tax=Pseudaestuariivita atlantica TaxID=1317121 RepID=A0A0L1JUX7_9RHOB|nr:hypothetical protein [Pseudaestuariivita atlantica]KNG95482.1 hypothetical protein ATO11_02465 [Pseudaestuariivita atlantica]